LDDAIARALRFGGGSVIVRGDETERLYSERLFCGRCGIGFPPLDPKLFSFNSRQGACPPCLGAGTRTEPDPDAILDAARSLRDGAVRPLELPEHAAEKTRFLRTLSRAGVPLDRPVRRLAERHRHAVLDGEHGVYGLLARLLEGGDGDVADFM